MAEAQEPATTATVETPVSIQTDEEFMNKMSEIKKLLNIDAIEELKAQQAELLRTKIVDVLKYVMVKIEEEEEETTSEGEGEEAEEEAEVRQPEPYREMPRYPGAETPSPYRMAGGKTTKKHRKQKGGVTMDLARITNTTEGALRTTKDPYQAISQNPEVPISLNVHQPFTAGNNKGFSSVSGLPASDLNTMLPIYGTTTQSGGSKKSKTRKSKK